jgi:hypothetical protein
MNITYRGKVWRVEDETSLIVLLRFLEAGVEPTRLMQ